MPVFENLTGKRFGKLTVLYRAEDYIQPSGQHKKMWHCKCDCGNECDVRAADLKTGNTRSCGCVQKESRGQSQFQDLSGQRFGELTVLYRLPNRITPSGQNIRMWHCKCDCGNEIDVSAQRLKNGLISCGCIKEKKRQSLAEQKKEKQLQRQKEKERILAEREQREKYLQSEEAIKHREALRLRLKQNRIHTLSEYRNNKLGSNSLAAKYPSIASEWDYEKNKGLQPQDILAASGKKVWWKCPNGHSYLASVGNKTSARGQGCPYCSSPVKKVLPGYNDLQTKYPEIAKEWHPTKNGALRPENVLGGSSRKVWWLCPNGHEYEMRILSRTKGNNCPYCSHQKILAGYSDLATTHPHLLAEWDYEKNDVLPTEIGAGSEIKAWWKCPFGHSYQARVYSRAGSSHTGCPICNKENHTSFPEQALYFYVKKYCPDAVNADNTAIGMELDIYIPSRQVALEYDGYNWHKNNRFEIKKNLACIEHGIKLIRIREAGLSLFDNCICLVRDDVRSDNCLSLVIKKAIAIIDSSIDADVNIELDTPSILESYITLRKESSLLNMYPEIAKEWHPTKNGRLTPEMVAPASHKKVWWLGKCGHEWQMLISSRTTQNSGCPICTNQLIIGGINDLLSNNPEICEEWDYERNNAIGLFPDKVGLHSEKKAWWKCKVCGTVWQSKIDGRTRMKAGCPKCAIEKTAEAKYKPVKCVETGVVYPSLKDAEEKTGINRHGISNCCKGKQKKAGRFHWIFY